MATRLQETLAAINANSMYISQATGTENRYSPEQAVKLVLDKIDTKLKSDTIKQYANSKSIDHTKKARLEYFKIYESAVREIFNEQNIVIIENKPADNGEMVTVEMDREDAIFLCTSYTKPGLGPLERLIRRPDVYTDIHVIEWNNILFEKRGSNKTFRYKYSFLSREWFEKFCQRLASLADKEINTGTNPYLDFELYKDRYSMCSPAICTKGYSFAVRIHPEARILFSMILEQRIVTREIADEMGYMLQARRSFFTAGITGSGKTTFWEAFMNEYLKGFTDKVLLCEDTPEQNLEELLGVVPLATENSSSNQHGDGTKMSLKDLITKVSLRQKPKHIVVGEGRGAELVDYVEAVETGNAAHCTGHGGTVKNVVNRICEKFTGAVPNITIHQIEKKLGQAHILMPLIHDIDGVGRRLLEYVELAWDEDNEKLIYNTIWKYNNYTDDWDRVGKYSEEFLFLVSRNKPDIYYDVDRLVEWFDLSPTALESLRNRGTVSRKMASTQDDTDELEGDGACIYII